MRLELQDVEAAGSGELALDEETLSRAAPAEQLVSSDIAGSRNTDLVGEE